MSSSTIAALLLGVLASCASNDHASTIDLCETPPPIVSGGSIELGLGEGTFAPLATPDQDVDLTLGLQGLWMLVMNVRTHDLDVATAKGAVRVEAVDDANVLTSLPLGCRDRAFVVGADGALELDSAFYLPFDPNRTTSAFEGTHLSITGSVIDASGHAASDTRTVVVHFPNN